MLLRGERGRVRATNTRKTRHKTRGETTGMAHTRVTPSACTNAYTRYSDTHTTPHTSHGGGAYGERRDLDGLALLVALLGVQREAVEARRRVRGHCGRGGGRSGGACAALEACEGVRAYRRDSPHSTAHGRPVPAGNGEKDESHKCVRTFASSHAVRKAGETTGIECFCAFCNAEE